MKGRRKGGEWSGGGKCEWTHENYTAYSVGEDGVGEKEKEKEEIMYGKGREREGEGGNSVWEREFSLLEDNQIFEQFFAGSF